MLSTDCRTERISIMHLNAFADGIAPLDMTRLEEFRSLLSSAADLGIPHSAEVAYRSRNVVMRHQRFHFLEWGSPEAPTILLLHGGHQSAHSWDLVSLHLADRYHVLALDQRGHGDSEWARDGDYSNYTMSLDARAFIEAMELGRPLVMAHSMGGRNTMLIQKHAPGLIGSAVIVDVGPETSEIGRKSIGNFVRANEVFDDLEHFVRNVRKYDPYRPQEHIERTVKYNMLERADGKYISKCDYRRWRGEIGQPDISRDDVSLDDVGRFDLPILVVRGENSNILTSDAADRFRAALPQGQFATVANCGHNVHSQNTLGFIQAIQDFLVAHA